MKFRLGACALACMLVTGSIAPVFTAKAYAQQTAKVQAPGALSASGLALAPSDSAFFASSLDQGKSWEEELSSGWVAEVRKVPYVQELEGYLMQQYKVNVGQNQQVKAIVEGPMVQDLLALLKDMTAQEVFLFGDSTWIQFAENLTAFQSEMVAFNPETPEEIQDFVLNIEQEQVDAIKIPNVIIGFKLTNDANARNYLDLFEGLARPILSSAEELKPIADGFKRKDLPTGQILSLKLNAADIPWELIPETDENAAEAIDHLKGLLEKRSVSISLAVLDNRGFFAISENPKYLETLGKGETLLTNEAIAQLLADKPTDLRGIQYASGEWRDAGWQMSFGSYFENLANQLTAALMKESEGSDELDALRDQLIEDAVWLDEKVTELQPEYDAILSYSTKKPEGLETITYDWTPSWLLENAKPLAVARHAGKSPLAVFASRQKWIYELDEIVEAVLEKVPGYTEALIQAGIIEEDSADDVQEIVDEVLPIVSELHDTIRTKIVPAMDGNESLLSVAALWTVTQLSPDMPPSDEPLPLPEIGVVIKLKNKDLFLSGLDAAVGSFNKLIDVAREYNPDNVPAELEFPLPKEEQLAKATRYFYPLELGGPFEQLELQMLLDDNFAVLGYSSRQVKDLFEDRPLATRPAWYKPTDAVAAVGYCDVSGMFRAIKPWIRYGLQTAVGDLEQPLGTSEDGPPLPTGSDILAIWDCFKKLGKAAGTAVIDEEGTTVSRWLWVRE